MDKDIRNLMIAIQENNRVYETILESGKISKDQMNTLMWHNGQIRDIILECRNLAVELNMRKEEFQYDKTGVNAIKITRAFYELLFEEEIYENEIELDLKLKLIITKMYELNSKWNSIINNFKNFTFNLSDPSWLKLIEDIENSTLTFASPLLKVLTVFASKLLISPVTPSTCMHPRCHHRCTPTLLLGCQTSLQGSKTALYLFSSLNK
ncbi:hypothetical protein [Caldicoprobacter algeriensis]|uniref:hypothetical protein n=1 Tax=Caldicoprobacter algeriensis TaxID=699281 RepID=UPI00207AF211|nr:hypothetical protein [Caldicoprobacter algeriensis]